MKTGLLFFVFFLSAYVETFGQNKVRIDSEGGKVGYTIANEKDEVLYQIKPDYDFLSFYVRVELGGLFLSAFYYDLSHCCDTEFVDIPVNPDNPTITVTDTFVLFFKPLVPEKLVIAKKNNKWGLLKISDEIAYPFEFDSIGILYNKSASKDGLVFLCYSKAGITVLNQSAKIVLSPAQIQQYYPLMTKDLIPELLKIALLDEQLVVQKEGQFVSKTIFVPDRFRNVEIGGKTIAVPVKAYNYQENYFKGGKFNVFNPKTNTLHFVQWSKHLKVKISSTKEFATPLQVKIHNRKSLLKVAGLFQHVEEPITIQFSK